MTPSLVLTSLLNSPLSNLSSQAVTVIFVTKFDHVTCLVKIYWWLAFTYRIKEKLTYKLTRDLLLCPQLWLYSFQEFQWLRDSSVYSRAEDLWSESLPHTGSLYREMPHSFRKCWQQAPPIMISQGPKQSFQNPSSSFPSSFPAWIFQIFHSGQGLFLVVSWNTCALLLPGFSPYGPFVWTPLSLSLSLSLSLFPSAT